MNSNSIRIWDHRWRMHRNLRLWSAASAVLLLILFISSSSADIQSIDVEPVVRKEQPDFEDDTGPVGGAAPGSLSRVAVGGIGNVAVAADKLHSATPGVERLPIPAADESVDLDISFMHAFVASLCVIIVSELGDKTFFISAIMAMNHPRLTVFAGAMTALAGMHVLSALFGYVITIVPRMYTFYASTALFAVFGLKMLKEGWGMSADEGREELEEVQTDLRKRDDSFEREPLEEGGAGQKRGHRNRVLSMMSRVFVQSFTLNVLAEWGDRSQIATVLMAAREDINGVIVGGLIGHFVCTGLAVMGGRMIASWISVRTVTLLGGVVFLLFAASALIIGP